MAKVELLIARGCEKGYLRKLLSTSKPTLLA